MSKVCVVVPRVNKAADQERAVAAAPAVGLVLSLGTLLLYTPACLSGRIGHIRA